MKKLIFVLSFIPLVSWAQCQSASHQAFDFWLGQWQVFTPDGKLAGSNVISSDLNTCVLREHYVTASGYEGRSLNMYDRQTDSWHQTWMDNTGLLLLLDGGWNGKQMVLEGKGKNQQGEAIIHRISWSPKADQSVRQHWQVSSDNGKSWTTAFDGMYKKLPNRE